MPRVQWQLRRGRPVIQVSFTLATGGQQTTRTLLADTGAGSFQSRFELLLHEGDCLRCGGIPLRPVTLGGAYIGAHRVYLIQVRIAQLGFDRAVRAVGVPSPPTGCDGIACFRFLSRFTYGNFGDHLQFGLEV